MQIKTLFPTSSTAVLIPIGRMDVEYSPTVRVALMEMVEKDLHTIIVDLSQVEFMDSSGLSALVTGMKAMRSRQGALSICSPNAQVRTALRLTMLDRVFPIFDTLAQAQRAAEETQG